MHAPDEEIGSGGRQGGKDSAMRCAKCQKLYDAAVRGLLSERWDRKVREHVAACPACAVVWQENESLRRLVRASSQPARMPDRAAFARMARQAMVQVEAERAKTPPARAGWWTAVADLFQGRQSRMAALVQAAALVAVGAIGGALITRGLDGGNGQPRMVANAPVATPRPTPEIVMTSMDRNGGPFPIEPIIPPLDVTPEPGYAPEQPDTPTHLLTKRDDAPPTLPAYDPMFFAQAMDRAVRLFEKLPATDEVEELRRIRTVSSQLEVAAVLTRLQDLKLQLVRDGRTEYIPDFHRLEKVLKQMAAVSPRSETPAGFAYLDTYQEAETALIRKEYEKAMNLFRKVIVEAHGTYLAARAKYQLGNIEFEITRDYGNALADYNEFLKETPDKYLSEAMLTQVRERIDLITANAANQYAPLRVFDSGEAAKDPADAARYHITLLRSYPDSPLVRKAIDAMARIVRQNPNDDTARQIVEELVQFQTGHGEHPLILYVDLAIADIEYYRTHNREQAEYDYSEILKKVEDPQLEGTVRERLAQLSRGN